MSEMWHRQDLGISIALDPRAPSSDLSDKSPIRLRGQAFPPTIAAEDHVCDDMPSSDELLRLRLRLRGAVQGVGFRPFVYRLANELHLPGWVTNSAQGLVIEVEGSKESLDSFLLRIEKDRPPRASIHSLESSFLDTLGLTGFSIRESDGSGQATAIVLPDIATCPDCLREVFDPTNRRYRYPFTNCTNCGPRFSIIEALPYDRPNTTMRRFVMCPECRTEYEQPLDRRFHAQPNACPICGPRLALWGRPPTADPTFDGAG